ncbi:MAG TPA: alpha/beta hydrolase [Eubacteriales bacterium]|jgi:acetyl esterase|nr:alpha/beta hydrolase [Clostridia bacterium]HRR90324.1 alpha/beta hydrolase [Eubacteriales bacterium]HRU84411.1 alpha/beta hydrolase [Eubacteriales bacterium]
MNRWHKFLLKKFISVNDKLVMPHYRQKWVEVEGIERFTDIPYIDDGNFYHLLDVYRPKNAEGKLPVVIDIHGGAWVYGDKGCNVNYMEGIAKAGYVAVNISYRLIPEGVCPKNIQDIFAAFNWTLENIGRYGGDIENIYLTGDSAGAHLSSFALSALADPELAALLDVKSDIKFNAAGLTCGVFNIDFFKKLKLPVVRALFRMFLGEDYKTSPILPYLTVYNNKVENFPPIFLNTGHADFVRRESRKLYKFLKEKGVECELLDMDNQNRRHKLVHCYSVLLPQYEESQYTTEKMLAFFKKYQKAAAEPIV